MKNFALVFLRFCLKKLKKLKTLKKLRNNTWFNTIWFNYSTNRLILCFSGLCFSGLCLFLVKSYKVFFSIYFGGACRFYPSCSCYADEAFSVLPLRRALFLVLKRLLKCHFFGPYGLDKPPRSVKNIKKN